MTDTHTIFFRGRTIQVLTPATESDLALVRSVIVRRRSDRLWMSAYVMSLIPFGVAVRREDGKLRHYNLANVRLPLDPSVMSCKSSTF